MERNILGAKIVDIELIEKVEIRSSSNVRYFNSTDYEREERK